MSRPTSSRQLQRFLFVLIGLVLVLQIPGGPVVGAAPQLSTISLSMSNPSCVQVSTASGTCSLQIGYLSANGSDPSFSRVEILVNGKLRLFMGGFFETGAYLSYAMQPKGLQVACGKPNDGGLPNYGKSYLVTANAYMADGSSTSISSTVYCPAYDGRTYLPVLKRK